MVGTPFGEQRLANFLRSRTAELVLHGLDLGTDIEVPADALVECGVSLMETAVREGYGMEVVRALSGRGTLPPGLQRLLSHPPVTSLPHPRWRRATCPAVFVSRCSRVTWKAKRRYRALPGPTSGTCALGRLVSLRLVHEDPAIWTGFPMNSGRFQDHAYQFFGDAQAR
jgi:hypothetical protein